jgi:tetratricopeptide (TPR) repeat protein
MPDWTSEFETALLTGSTGYHEERIFLNLIDAYLEQGKVALAYAAGMEGLKQHPYSVDLLCSYASVLLEMDDPGKALLILDQANSLSPNEKEVSFLRVETLIELDRYAEAERLLQTLLLESDESDLADAWYFQSIVEEQRENWEDVHHCLTLAVKYNMRFQEALERLWLSTEMLGNYAESAKFYKEILDIDPYSWQVWYNLGHAYSCLEDHHAAVEAFDYACIINENFEHAWRDQGDVWMHLGNPQKAVECYKTALEKAESGDADLLIRLGEAIGKTGRIEEARQYLKSGLAKDHQNDEGHYHLGRLCLLEKESNAAIAHLESAININNEREEYYVALAEAYFQLGMYSLAEISLHRAIELAPEQSSYWIQYAAILLHSDSLEEALEILDTAISQHASTHLDYARIACLFKMGKRQEACQSLCLQLAEDFKSHQTMFDMLPELSHDPDVISLVRAFRTE